MLLFLFPYICIMYPTQCVTRDSGVYYVLCITWIKLDLGVQMIFYEKSNKKMSSFKHLHQNYSFQTTSIMLVLRRISSMECTIELLKRENTEPKREITQIISMVYMEPRSYWLGSIPLNTALKISPIPH